MIFLLVSFSSYQAFCDNQNAKLDKNTITREQFNESFNMWLIFKQAWDETEYHLSSIGGPTFGKEWDDMIGLGPGSLQYIVENINKEPLLVGVFTEISRICVSCDKEKYDQENAINKIMHWWDNDRKHLDADIRKDLALYKEMKSHKKSQPEIDVVLRLIRLKYGIFSLPYFLQEIEKDNQDFIPMTWALLDGVEGDKEKKVEFERKLLQGIEEPRKRIKHIHDVTTRNKDRIDKIKNLIQEYKDEGNSGK